MGAFFSAKKSDGISSGPVRKQFSTLKLLRKRSCFFHVEKHTRKPALLHIKDLFLEGACTPCNLGDEIER